MNNFTKFLSITLVWLVCFPGLARTSGDPVTVHAAYVAPPVNDDCANAITLTPGQTCTPTAGTTVEATQSLVAITCGTFTGTANDDVWYKFTATAASHIVTVVGSTGFDAVVDVRSGGCNGTNIDCADATISAGTETVTLSGLTVGTTYLVRVYGYGSIASSNGTFTICVTTPFAPTNDDCAGAISLTPGTTCTPTAGTTVGATQSLAAITCGTFTGTANDDVWYQFTATATSHTVTVVGGTGFDAVVDVRSGGCNGTNIGCADATISAGTETVVLNGLTVGTTYLVRVYGYGSIASSNGTFTICVTSPLSALTNDDCAGAITLTPGTTCTPTAGTTVGATQSLAAITCGTFTGTANDDVWYQFTATANSHTVTVVGGTGFDAVVDVRSGGCNGTNIGCADATTSAGTETVVLSGLTVGTTYLVRVYGYGSIASSNGTFTICVTSPLSALTNDDCAGAITLTPGTTCTPTAGTTVGATQSLAAITCGTFTGTANDDVWYQFTATANSHTVTVVGGIGFDAVVDVRSGGCNGTNIGCADATTSAGTETVVLSGLTVGTTYLVRVYGYGSIASSNGTFTICVTTPVPGCLPAPLAPTNGQTGICPGTSVTLRWPVEGLATSYDVYFGTTPVPPFVANVTGTTYAAGALPTGTYYWQIRPTSSAGTAQGCPIWTFTVSDNVRPVIACPAPITLPAAPGMCSAIVTFANATATDNCTNPPTITNLGLASGSSFPVGTTNVTFLAMDVTGNSATCSFAVSINDTQVPVISCPAAINLSAATGGCTAVATFAVTGTDNCTNPPTITNLGLASGSSFPVGATNVTFRATDASGNSATCSFTVTVNEMQVPVITCPAAVNLSTDTGLCTAVATFPNANATDNCTASPVIVNLGLASGSSFPVGTTNVTFQATDVAGNSATCSFAVTVTDAQVPIIQCPASITLPAASGLCSAVTTFADARATDNCITSLAVVNLGLASGSSFPVGTTNVTFQTTDASGNSATCSFAVTITDTQVPTITCPAPLTLPAVTGGCAAVATFTNATATDNCTASPAMVNTGLPSGSSFPVGTTNVIFQATDASGNSATCALAVTVNETQVPTISCPASVTLPAATGLCTAVATFANATATDNCTTSPTIVNLGLASSSSFPVGTTNVTFRATDASGNSATCSFAVIVNDTQVPTITCPAAVSLLAAPGLCTAVATFANATAIDNCTASPAMVNTGLPSGSTFPAGTTNVIFQATDASGNSATCALTVVVNDAQTPVVACPTSITVENDPGYCTAVVNFAATATDNCGIVSTTYSADPLSEFNLGTTSVAFTATDAQGNISSCTFLINVDLRTEICNGLDDDCDGEVDEFEDFAFITKNFGVTGGGGDQYGYAVSVQGDYAIVGAPFNTINGQQVGAVYLLNRNAGGENAWGQLLKITAPDGQAGDQFGSSVALQGDYALVGAPGDDDQGANAGAVYVLFRHQNGTDQWGVATKLKATGGQAGDQFGTSVGLDGTLGVIGANQDDDQGLDAGSAYVFRHTGAGTSASAWTQVAKLLAANGASGNNFGISVAIDGPYALVGADLSDAGGQNTGAAYLFHQDAGGSGHWGQVKQLLPGAGNPTDNFGHSVALDVPIALIGGHLNDQYGSNAGQAYIFEQNAGGADHWSETERIHAYDASANDQFGFSVALDSNFAVIGARQDNPLGPNSGSAYVFERQINGQWLFFNKLVDLLGATGDQFGYAVDIDEHTIVAGAPTDDNGLGRTDQGSVTVFAAVCGDDTSLSQAGDRENMNDEIREADKSLQVRCYPSPFHDVLNVEVAPGAALDVHITVVNSLNQEVEMLYDGLLEQATQFQWNATRQPAGVYFLRVESGAGVQTRAVVLTPR